MERVLKTYVQLVYAFMYLPVAVVALFSFNSAEMLAFPMTGFTLDWYDVAIHDSRLLGGFANSILIAAPTALISTTLGAMAALALTRHRFRGRIVFAALLIVPFFIPKIILAVADVIAMAVVGVPHGVAVIIAAQSLIILPFSAMVIASVLIRLDHRLEEAAADLGASGWQVFSRVQLPLMRNGVGRVVLYRLRLVVVRVRRDVFRQRADAAAVDHGRVRFSLPSVAEARCARHADRGRQHPPGGRRRAGAPPRQGSCRMNLRARSCGRRELRRATGRA